MAAPGDGRQEPNHKDPYDLIKRLHGSPFQINVAAGEGGLRQPALSFNSIINYEMFQFNFKLIQGPLNN
jgi:hypothetical protein